MFDVKKYYKKWCKNNKKKIEQYRKKYKYKCDTKNWNKKHPWYKTWKSIDNRVSNRCGSNGSYYKRGIKNFLTMKKLKYLWDRDNASTLKFPSIHRINKNGNYTVSNCKYIEYEDHKKLHRVSKKSKQKVG